MRIKQDPDDFVVEEITDIKILPKGKYTLFLLDKTDRNTEDVIQEISKKSRLPRKYFGYAGTKDKRAHTFQYCSVKGNVKDISGKGYSIRRIGFSDSPISLGDLNGNRFRIKIRELDTPPRRTSWTINYFDDQRFGGHNLEIGTAIMKKDFRHAAEMLGHSSGRDYVASIRKIPLKILKMYINSVQSYIWNQVVSSYLCRNFICRYSRYKHGRFSFPDKRPDNCNVALLSFDTKIDEIFQPYFDQVLADLGLCLQDFVIRSIPDLTPFGGFREVVVELSDLRISRIKKRICTVEFSLPKGSYATVALRHLAKDLLEPAKKPL